MPDPGMDQPAPASAPPDQQGPGFQSAAGAGGMPGGGILPPTTSAQPQDVHPAGLNAMGMEIARKAMAMLHVARSLIDPYSEEGKAADKMFNHGIKHFAPDTDTMRQQGSPPQMAGAGMRPPQPQGQMPGAPMPPRGPIPMGAPGMQG